MSNTDNAFIKAYAEELAVALGRPAKQVDRRSIRPDGNTPSPVKSNQRVSLSGLYASPEALHRTVATPVPVVDAPSDAESRDACADTAVADRLRAEPQNIVPMPAWDSVTPPARTSRPDVRHEAGPPRDEGVPRQNEGPATTHQRLDSAETKAPPQWHASFAERTGDDARWARPAEAEPTVDRGAAPDPESSHDFAAMSGSAEESFRPLWEVDQFHWLESTEQLVDEYASWLAPVLDRLQQQSQAGTHVSAITSFARREGRTMLAAALARLAARRGISAVLVDGDFEHPQLAESLGLSIEQGWDELGPSAPVSEAAVQSIDDDLTVLPLRPGPKTQHPHDPDQIGRVFSVLSAHFDVVLVDVGPMFTAARHWFGRQHGLPIDAALLVRDVRNVTEHQLTDVADRIAARGIEVLGIAENYQSKAVSRTGVSTKLAS